jgi:hypothetical protein
MSSNRLSYDACAYEKSLQQSTSPLDYVLYNGKYENCSKCRFEFGVVGGNGVSLFDGNLVDLESELRGQTREASLCPSKFYTPNCKNCNNGSRGLPCSSTECKPKMMHQPSCQMQYYPKTPVGPSPSKVTGCDYQENNRNSNRPNEDIIEKLSNYVSKGGKCSTNSQCRSNQCSYSRCK